MVRARSLNAVAVIASAGVVGAGGVVTVSVPDPPITDGGGCTDMSVGEVGSVGALPAFVLGSVPVTGAGDDDPAPVPVVTDGDVTDGGVWTGSDGVIGADGWPVMILSFGRLFAVWPSSVMISLTGGGTGGCGAGVDSV